MAQHDDDRGVEECTFRTQYSVCNERSHEGGHVDEAAVGAHNGQCSCLIHTKSAIGDGVVQIESKDGLHAVEAESLPHLHAEEVCQPPRLAEEFLFAVSFRHFRP